MSVFGEPVLMQPMGRKPTRFPGKIDHHPPKGSVNWWEVDISTESNKSERANGKKEIAEIMTELDEGVLYSENLY